MAEKSRKSRYEMKRPKSSHAANEAGIALALVVVGGLVLTIGAMVLSARSFKNLAGSIRLGQSREARKIAESGMAKILDNLNKNYPYLLIENCEVVNNSPSQLLDSPECSGWQEVGSGVSVKGTFEQRGAVCPAAKLPASSIMNSLYVLDSGYTASSNITGKYRLIDYQFIGDSFQGGVATIKVQGQRISKDGSTPTITASAIIEKEVTIAPKCCDDAPYANLERCGASRKSSTPECDESSDRDKYPNGSTTNPDSSDQPSISTDISSDSSYQPSVSNDINPGSSYHQNPDSVNKSSNSNYNSPDISNKPSDSSTQSSDSSDRHSGSSDKNSDSEKNSDSTGKRSDREPCEKEKESVTREFAAIGTNKWNLIQLKD